jgi:hypothetical protein
MTINMDEAMEDEFDTVAEWTAQVAADLGPDYFIPAGCRGSGQPAALDWLLDGMRPRAGELPELDDPPEGDHFPTRGQLEALVGFADLSLLRRAQASDLPEASGDWRERTDAVERELRRRYGDTPQLTEANQQSDRIGHLLRSGELSCELMVLGR